MTYADFGEVSMPATGNRYLDGPFAPVVEETTAFDLPVTGRVPRELTGRYLRIGPNTMGVDDPATHLWASGEGMVHGVRLSDGKAKWYRNRWVRSGGVLEALGEPERENGLERWRDYSPNVHVISHCGTMLALVEAGALPYELGYELETIGPSQYGVTGEGFSPNAHSKVDPRTGDLHSVAYIPSKDFVQHIVTGADGFVAAVNNIPTSIDTPYMHDFSLTENHVVVFDTPLQYSTAALQAGHAAERALRWNPDHGGRVGVMPRAGGDVRWFESDPSHVSHVMNSHETGSTISIDLIRVDGPVNAFDPGSGQPTFDRWTIDLMAGTFRSDRLDDRPQDFPRVNESMISRPHRYGYSTVSSFYGNPFPVDGNHPDEAFSNALVKHDLHRDTSEVHGFVADAAVSEAAFAANPYGTAEDDGYLIAYIHNPDRGASDLVILSAQDFTGEPVARVHLPVRVPLGLHGSWIPDDRA